MLRLLASLRRAMAQRRELLASAGVAAVSELDPTATEAPPTIVVLLDGYAQFAAAYDRVAYGEPVQTIQQLAAEGRPLGLHLVLTADRRADVPGALAGVVTKRLALRMADHDESVALGVPRSAAGAPLPPGRGFTREGLEVQLATVDVETLAPRLAERHPGLKAPRIRALPAQVAAERLPAPAAPLTAVAGLGSDALSPVVVDMREDHFLVAGAMRRGRSTALATLTASLRRGAPELECHLLAPRRSPLTATNGWASQAADPQACSKLADELLALTERPPGAPPVLVVVDDGTELAELPALETLVRRGRDAGVRVLAAVETHGAQRAYGGWIRELRNARRGLLLAPDPEADGELLGVRLPRTRARAAGPRPRLPRRRRRGRADPGRGARRLAQVALADEPGPERALHELGALGVLRQALETELREQHPQMGLDAVERQVQLVGDLLVGRGPGERWAVLVGAAERDQDAQLRVREATDLGEVVALGRGAEAARARVAEHEDRAAAADRLAVAQPPAALHALLTDERPVRGEAVVEQDPLAGGALDHRVQAGDAAVPPERHVVLGTAPDRQPLHRLVELEDALGAVLVAVDEEREAAALGLQPRLQLGGGGGVGGEGRLAQGAPVVAVSILAATLPARPRPRNHPS